MSVYDHRTVGEDKISFYVFDDLRWQQNTVDHRPRPDIYRYDTLAEAVAKFKELPSHMKPAIGIHLSDARELDIVHRFGDESVLVTDYRKLPAWRHNDVVDLAVGQACEALNIEWQLDHDLLGVTVAIPSSRLYNLTIPDSYLARMGLAPLIPAIGAVKADPLTAINEVFCEEGGGWISLREAQAKGISYDNPELLKVSRFNVRTKYLPTDKMSAAWGGNALHLVDVSPVDLSILQEGYMLRYGEQKAFDKALDFLVSDLHQFAKDTDPYEYADQGPDYETQLNAARDQLSRGDTGAVRAYLEDFLSGSHAEEELPSMAKAACLLARVKNLDGLERFRKPTLNQQMENAESRKVSPTNSTPSPEKDR